MTAPLRRTRWTALATLISCLAFAACGSEADSGQLGNVSAPPGAGYGGAGGASGAGSSGAPGLGGLAGSSGAAGSGGTSDAGAPGSSGSGGAPQDLCADRPIDDENPCTVDACDPATGNVSHVQNLDDGDLCTDDACDLAQGVMHTVVAVGDGDPCTIDTCNSKTGISHTPVAGCAPCLSDSVCDDGNPCTIDICDPKTSCGQKNEPDGASASDGNPCNGVEVCLGGMMEAGVPIDVDDADACTFDTCDPQTGKVTHEQLAGCLPPP